MSSFQQKILKTCKKKKKSMISYIEGKQVTKIAYETKQMLERQKKDSKDFKELKETMIKK